ncbi:Phosphate regulon transcriptional regulatory protein PhoB (SphR) [hydrothermal vent metagenome]|uniref:Phosphate regulon transcriptional regulatory protein PhoB (SphR) n=1 Tax=hydrothermal vent metagenome TaxID=652676 RepID=A0A3B0UYU0_9ZZZZ
MSKTILVVDDEPRLVALVKAYLEQGGYQVVAANNGRDALFVARQEKPDLILLDIMMPEMDGHEFMRVHRQEQATPIILLTAKVEEDDKIIGLELGADDYVTKPFSPRELLARVRAVLRRGMQTAVKSNRLRVADVLLDFDHYLVEVAGKRIDLTRSEFDLLAILMGAPGRAYSRFDLLDKLQGTTFVGSARTVDVHIKNLRGKIEPNPRQPRYVETVYGVGYRFAVE